jgi:hypothetical protein
MSRQQRQQPTPRQREENPDAGNRPTTPNTAPGWLNSTTHYDTDLSTRTLQYGYPGVIWASQMTAESLSDASMLLRSATRLY